MDISFMKLIWLLFKPGNALFLLMGVTAIHALYTHAKWAKRVSAFCLTALMVIGFTPMSYWLAAPLELRHPNRPLPEHVAGLIILGGYERPALSLSHGTPQTSESAERLLTGAMLAHRFPDRPIILTGRGRGAEPEVQTGLRFLLATGISTTRIRLEGRSRNTYENATLSRPLAHEEGPWVLITSATHMPRALMTFQANGWDVLPYSTDFMTDKHGGAVAYRIDMAENIALFNRVSKEWIGFFVYTMKGYFRQDHS